MITAKSDLKRGQSLEWCGLDSKDSVSSTRFHSALKIRWMAAEMVQRVRMDGR